MLHYHLVTGSFIMPIGGVNGIFLCTRGNKRWQEERLRLGTYAVRLLMYATAPKSALKIAYCEKPHEEDQKKPR